MEIIVIESQAFKEIQDQIKGIREELKNSKYQSIGDTWLSSKQVQKILGVSQKTWQTYRDKQMIQFSQIGQKIYVRVSWLEEFMEEYKIQKRRK